jgi:hypothetical protein
MGRNRIQRGVTASAIPGARWTDHDADTMKLPRDQPSEDTGEMSGQLLRANWFIQRTNLIKQALQIAMR